MDEQLMNLISKYSGVTEILIYQDLEKDLGVSGDDAYDLIMEYSRTFSVDVSMFPFDDYFYDEGGQIIRIFHWCLCRYKRKKFTIVHLQRGIENGELL